MGGWGANYVHHFYDYFSSHPWLGRVRKVLDFICLYVALQHRHWLKPGGSAKSGPFPTSPTLKVAFKPHSHIIHPATALLSPSLKSNTNQIFNPGTRLILFHPTNLYIHVKEPFTSHTLQFATKLEQLANPPSSYISWHIRIFPSPEDFLLIPKSLPEAVIYLKKYWALPI